jgi:MFS family permease
MNTALTKFERKIAVALASVFATRLLGLFLIMPVFAIYGQSLQGYSPLWVGIAIGAYGLTQAVMQVPMGMASDRFGRKPVIYAGLILFFIGSVTAALADSVYVVALGRALQGVGAISSVILALAADLTREEQRTKVMAVIGMFIGVSFSASLVIGPALAVDLELSGLFWCTAVLALVGILIVRMLVPDAVQHAPRGETTAIPRRLLTLARDPQLWRLNLGIFVLHLVMTAVFVSLPIKLIDAGIAVQGHWLVYFPALMLSFMLMVPLIIIGVKKRGCPNRFSSGAAIVDHQPWQHGMDWAIDPTDCVSGSIFYCIQLFRGIIAVNDLPVCTRRAKGQCDGRICQLSIFWGFLWWHPRRRDATMDAY